MKKLNHPKRSRASVAVGSICLILSIVFANDSIALQLSEVKFRFAELEKKYPESAFIILEANTGRIILNSDPERSIRKRYPPGSLAKIWSAIILLENQEAFQFHPGKELFCPGKYFPNEKIQFRETDFNQVNLPEDDHDHLSYSKCSVAAGHGKINLRDALSTIGEGRKHKVSLLKVAQIYSSIYADTPLLKPFEMISNRKIPQKQYDLDISSSDRIFIKNSMRESLFSGTLKKLRINNPRITITGGKTGSATPWDKKYSTHGWNVILFRESKTPYVLVTFVYKGTGSKEAKEISREILSAL